MLLTALLPFVLMLQAPAASPVPPGGGSFSNYHVVFLKLGPKWVRDLPTARQPGIREHGEYMSRLSSEGTIVLGGPFLDDPAAGNVSGAMVVFALADAAEAKRLMDVDPGVKAGLFEIGEVKRLVVATGAWRPWKKAP